VLELWGWETVINSIGTDIKFPLEKRGRQRNG